jgi:hypothetical protein
VTVLCCWRSAFSTHSEWWITCSHTSRPPITTTHEQKKIATHAKRSLRIGAVNGLRWVWREALFIERSFQVRLPGSQLPISTLLRTGN